jgi:hypothetical protein
MERLIHDGSSHGDALPGFWSRTLHAPQDGPEDQAPAPVTDHAEWREQLDMDNRGLERGQVQLLGYRGDSPLVPEKPGAAYVRAAAAIGHDFGRDARAEYAARQHAAAHEINGFRRR